MGVINSIFGAIADVFFAPFRPFGPWAGMIAVSLAVGVLMLAIFKKTSNQAGIKRAKNAIKAHLLEIRLYKSDLGQSFRSQGAILGANFRYMGHALRPMLVMIIPVLFILAQLNLRYGADALPLGGQALVKMTLTEGTSVLGTPVTLAAPAGIVVETPPLRIEDEREVAWRIRGEAAGVHRLSFDVGGTPVEKIVVVAQSAPAKIPALRSRKFLDLVLAPGENPLPKNLPVETIEIVYPAARLAVFGLSVHWLVAFFVLSILFGFALKGVFKVEI
jgi:uncharacterized membrane protein (DUF106 family)